MDNSHGFRIGDIVVFKTNQLIVFNKPAGLPVQEDKTGDTSLLKLAEIYCKKKLHIINRLDRPASGLVLFAKNKSAAAYLSEQFRNRTVQKSYLAVVGEKPGEPRGLVRHFIKKDTKDNLTKAHDTAVQNATMASLAYNTLASIENYHLIEVKMESGMHHQIRSQLGAIGSPIKGDVKYGFRRGNKNRSIHLHGWKISFIHPVSEERIELICSPPHDVVWDALLEKVKLTS